MKARLAVGLIVASLSTPANSEMWELYGDWNRCEKHKKSLDKYYVYHKAWREQFMGAKCGLGDYQILPHIKSNVFYCKGDRSHVTALFFSRKADCERVRAHMVIMRGSDSIEKWLRFMSKAKARIRAEMP